uniref:NmrA-like domain-containing protein n=1 Tax=Moniliophthora roreri TaxID=221103 RepID=A0A0W0G9U0_MONRR
MTRSQRIAIAGGTGGIGSHIVEGLLEIKERDSLHIIVLSRSSKSDVQFAGASAPVIGVDYQDIDAVEAVLREHQIDTIISTVSGSDFAQAFAVAQQRLLDAALRVPSVRRFAPSEFAVNSEKLVSVPLYRLKVPILQSLRKVKETRPGFEFTVFSCGIFMNYLGYGNPKPDGMKAHGHLKSFPYIVDISKAAADVPGDGTTNDMAGDVISINEIIRIAESTTGKKFDVKYNTEEDILARMDPNPTGPMGNFYMEVYLGMVRGECEQGTTLNKLTDVKPTSVETYLRKWWGN